MATLKLKKDFYWCGVLDKDLRVFDIIMYTEYGTSYNAYLLKCGGKTILFETVKDKFFDEYLANLTSLVKVKDIDYIVVNHTEPDHAGSIAKLLDINPNIEIIGSVGAINFLAEILNRPFKAIKATHKMTMNIGGKTLQFFMLANLHWPDTMYTYIVEDKTLLTCDSFGAHYCLDGILESKLDNVSGYLVSEKYYFDNIIGPFKNPYMLNAISTVRELEVDMICTGHGVVHDINIPQLLDRHKSWSMEVAVKNPNDIVVAYVSAYGYTGKMAKAIADGAKSLGASVGLFDMVTADKSIVVGEINAAKAIAIGTPTILGDALKPIWDLLTDLYKPMLGRKTAFAFGSYGWSGEGVPNITARLAQLNLNTEEGIKVRFQPTEQDLKLCFERGVALAKLVRG